MDISTSCIHSNSNGLNESIEVRGAPANRSNPNSHTPLHTSRHSNFSSGCSFLSTSSVCDTSACSTRASSELPFSSFPSSLFVGVSGPEVGENVTVLSSRNLCTANMRSSSVRNLAVERLSGKMMAAPMPIKMVAIPSRICIACTPSAC